MNRNDPLNQVLRVGERLARRWLRDRARADRTPRPGREQPSERPTRRHDEQQFSPPPHAGAYPGDFTGRPVIEYHPVADDHADPGEIVWTWVPFEEDHSQGKDRPVLVIGRDGRWLLALQVSTTNDPEHREREARFGRRWIDIGTGAWDNQSRPSEVRVNRILRIDPAGVRRIGARLDRPRFDRVAAEVKRHHRATP